MISTVSSDPFGLELPASTSAPCPVKKISPSTIFTSAAPDITRSMIGGWVGLEPDDRYVPRVGDVMYGRLHSYGQHRELENRDGRIHRLTTATRALLVFGHRYALAAFEGRVPEQVDASGTVQLLARSGVIGRAEVRAPEVHDPTEIKLLGGDRNTAETRHRGYRATIQRYGAD